MKKFLATLLMACFAFTFTVGSIGCSGDTKKDTKKDEKPKDEKPKDEKPK